MADRVLVTGASGFIAKHIVVELLRHGFDVRGTVRGEERAEDVRKAVRAGGEDAGRCEFVHADLRSQDGWAEAAASCRYVLHTASPFPLTKARGEPPLVETARGGTDVVLRAAAAAGAERATVTSSIASVVYGHPRSRTEPFGEGDVTNLESRALSSYARSKTVAERHAWDVSLETGLPISTINPGLVLGPVLDARLGTSARIVAIMMKGRIPLVPDITIPSVDVRDVALAHVRAILVPEAGRRFLLAAPDAPSFPRIAEILAEAFPEIGHRLPRRRLPAFMLQMAGLLSPGIGMIVRRSASSQALDTTPAETVLGISFTPARDAVVALGESLLRYRCV